MVKPTILLLPGAWHSPAHYEKIRKELDKHGYETEAIALATVDPKNPPNTDVDSDVKVISAAIQNILTLGKDVVLVTHSYSGIPGQSAAYAFIKDSQSNGSKLVAIAMMCSFLYPPHIALMRPMDNKPSPIHVVSADGNLVDIGGPGPEHLFYNDVSRKEAAHAKSLLKTNSWWCNILPPSAEGVG